MAQAQTSVPLAKNCGNCSMCHIHDNSPHEFYHVTNMNTKCFYTVTQKSKQTNTYVVYTICAINIHCIVHTMALWLA